MSSFGDKLVVAYARETSSSVSAWRAGKPCGIDPNGGDKALAPGGSFRRPIRLSIDERKGEEQDWGRLIELGYVALLGSRESKVCDEVI
jgi:hypothetical protein